MHQPDNASDPHVAVLAFPFSTHAAPLLSIISRLAFSAPNTHFSFFSTAESNNSLLSTHKHYFLPNVKAYNVSNGVPDNYVLLGKPQEDIELFMKAAPENLRKAVAKAAVETRRKVSCLVTDSFLWFAAEMAEEMQVPFVPCWLSGSSSLSTHFYTDVIREKMGLEGIEGREDEQLKFIQGMSKVCIRDLPEGVLFGNLQSVFSDMLHRMGLKLPRGDAVVINSFEELDPTINNDLKSKFKQFLNVGPFNLISPPPAVPDTSGCLLWLDRQKPASVAYLGFGSVSRLSPNEIVAVAEALEASKLPFIWSLKKNLQAHLPNTKLNGIVVEWAPQLDVLAHNAVGVFINHGGWSSLMESMACGVPMIIRPFFGDQRLNARMVQDEWKIGVSVEGGIITKRGFLRSLDLILWQENGKKMRENVRKFKQLAETAVGPQGSSMKNFKALVDIVSRPKDA
nr:UFGT [Dimocarpus longan]